MVNSVRLREERERLGLSQAEFGERAGVTKQSQHMYEAGKRYPDANYLSLIAEMGVDVLYVLTGNRTPKSVLTAEETTLLTSYSRASQEGKVAIRAVLAVAAPADITAKQVFHGEVGAVINGDVKTIDQKRS